MILEELKAVVGPNEKIFWGNNDEKNLYIDFIFACSNIIYMLLCRV